MPKFDLPPQPLPESQVWRSWLTISDALIVQRLHLHIAECDEATAEGSAVPGVAGVSVGAVLVAKPTVGHTESAAITDCGLGPFASLPHHFGKDTAGPNPLEKAALEAADEVTAGIDGIHEVGRGLAVAAAWWTGYFGTIRHRGVHHLTLAPVVGAIEVAVLEEAARVVSLGVVARVLETSLRSGRGDTSALEVAYCRAVTACIEVERHLPAVLDQLGELRLADLVILAVPWRGQFTKYSSGTGAGQVE